MVENKLRFSTVLAFLEDQGWELMRVWEPYRIFERRGSGREDPPLPILVEVHEGMVDDDVFERIQGVCSQQEEGGRGS
jgi:hypothetical protein